MVPVLFVVLYFSPIVLFVVANCAVFPNGTFSEVKSELDFWGFNPLKIGNREFHFEGV